VAQLYIKSKRKSEISRSLWADAGQQLKRNKVFMAACVILAVYLIVGLFAPWIARYDYARQFRMRDGGLTANGSPVAPNSRFWMGTDTLGRDLYSRLVWGTRTALLVGISVSLITTLVSVLYGSIASLIGGWVDDLMMRAVDVIMGLPYLFVVLLFVAIFRTPNLYATIFVLCVLQWTGGARVFRNQVSSIKEYEFVLAERSLGASTPYIFVRHIFPQLVPLIIVFIGLGIPGAIFAEAGLSFLGLGVPPPAPSWGGMVSQGIGLWRNAWWMLVFPAAALVGLVIVFNLIADGLRQALDPRLKGQ